MKTIQNTKDFYTSKQFAILEFIFFLSIPIFIRLYIQNFLPFRHLVITVVAPYMYIVGKKYNFNSLESYGLTRKNLRKSTKALILPTLIWVLIMIIVGTTIDIDHIRATDMLISPKLPIWFIISSYAFLSVPIQEIVYRGFLINRIMLVSKNKYVPILYSSAIFGLSHFIFQNIVGSVLTALVSIIWIRNFIKYQNLWPIIASHFIIGCITLYATLMI